MEHRSETPLRSPMYEKGVMTRVWVSFFNFLLKKAMTADNLEILMAVEAFKTTEPWRQFVDKLQQEVIAELFTVGSKNYDLIIEALKKQVVVEAYGTPRSYVADLKRLEALIVSDAYRAYEKFRYYLPQPVWDDMRIVPGAFDRPGVSDPAIQVYDVNGGGVNTYLWEFKLGDIASFTVQFPHGYKVGGLAYVHIHWTPGPWGATESGKYVGWKIDYSWANINGNFGTMSTLDLSDVCDGTNHKHQMTPDVLLTQPTSMDISSMLVCNIKRTDTGTDDTWASLAAGHQPMLLEIDFHYQIDTVGSRDITLK